MIKTGKSYGFRVSSYGLSGPEPETASNSSTQTIKIPVESVKIRRKLLLRKGGILQTARVESMLKRAEDCAAGIKSPCGTAAENALRALRLLRKLGNHCMISVKIRRKSLVYIDLILQMHIRVSRHEILLKSIARIGFIYIIWTISNTGGKYEAGGGRYQSEAA